ncbi:MAG: 4-hydroxythreonine-4-phosphate dehydrogenase PdxA [Lautropia sp.]
MTRLVITLGDPAGIGPEIILKAGLRLRGRPGPELIVVAPRACLADNADRLGGEVAAAWAGGPAARGFAIEELPPPAAPIPLGTVSAEAGSVAYASIVRAVEMVQAGAADAIVTAPISKEAINLAGHPFSGHTEVLAHLTRTASPVMMLAHGNMRVSHVSTHVALSDVPALVTPERLRRVILLTHDALLRLGIERPRIAVAALNPHAGEGGMLGKEDVEIVRPLVQQLAAEGIPVGGPEAGDTIFVKLSAGQYDAVVAMYHDQGHIPIKLLGFRVDPKTGVWDSLSGVNITLGLPVLRTSVDHGTAFDIAGRSIASEQSLVEAIEYADALVRNGSRHRIGQAA